MSEKIKEKIKKLQKKKAKLLKEYRAIEDENGELLSQAEYIESQLFDMDCDVVGINVEIRYLQMQLKKKIKSE